MSQVNQQLEQKLVSSSDTKKGRTDADWRRIESEKKVGHHQIVCIHIFTLSLCMANSMNLCHLCTTTIHAQVLSERCCVLSESVRSLEERVQQKTSELEEASERFGRMERDLRQKRQLLDSQRDKIKTVTQQATEDRARVVRARLLYCIR